MRLAAAVEGFLAAWAPVAPGDIILVAYSGGPDSTALVAGLRAAAPRLGFRLAALHLDHATDPGSGTRAGASYGPVRRVVDYATWSSGSEDGGR